ncbi:GNAT family N-acetyltransferase [Isosphaeraceae bacterium EP7]
MNAAEHLRTERLLLRPWRDEDRAPYAALNADPAVMEYFLAALTRDQSDAMVDRFITHHEEHGFGPWAVEVPGISPLVGYVGLLIPRFETSFTPCVEIGWRLAREHWGKGYAIEAARAVILDAFGRLGLDEIVSFTVPANVRSQSVMQRLGMTRFEADDFDHPNVPEGHPLRRHVLYRIRRPA